MLSIPQARTLSPGAPASAPATGGNLLTSLPSGGLAANSEPRSQVSSTGATRQAAGGQLQFHTAAAKVVVEQATAVGAAPGASSAVAVEGEERSKTAAAGNRQ